MNTHILKQSFLSFSGGNGGYGR